MTRERSGNQTPYLVIVAVVAVVAVVTLVMKGTGGSILQGAPVAGDFVKGCVESDPTYDFKIKGSVQVGFDTKWDYCVKDVLHQYSCDNNIARPLRPVDCQFGCENGVCLSQPTYG